MKKILIVVAHPDDELFGCGGSIPIYKDSNSDIRVLYISEGVTSRYLNQNDSKAQIEIKERELMANESSKFLGYKILDFLRYPNLRMQNIDFLELVKKILFYIEDFKPDLVFTHHPGDLNPDHGITYNAVISASRPTEKFIVKEINIFEIPSSTEWSSNQYSQNFLPTLYINIENSIEKKLEALNFFKKEMRSHPNPRSQEYIKSLAIIRGGEVGIKYAEAFRSIRKVI